MPWFVAVFGRDAVVTSLQTMAVSYEFGRGTHQASSITGNSGRRWHDAQPGKILHELRRGELAQPMKFPHTLLGQWMLPSSGYYLTESLSLEC